MVHLNKLEEDKEALCNETEDVAQVLNQEVVDRDWEDEWSQETTDVELDDQIQECLGLVELEVDQLLHSFQFIEFKFVLVFLVQELG